MRFIKCQVPSVQFYEWYRIFWTFYKTTKMTKHKMPKKNRKKIKATFD